MLATSPGSDRLLRALVGWCGLAALGACVGRTGPDVAETDTDVADTDTDVADTDTDVADTDTDALAPLRLPAPVGHTGQFAVASPICANCHSNADTAVALRDPSGRGVAPVDLFRGSMMAHAARDPFFRATLAATAASVPSRSAEIAQECLACHAPAAWAEATLAGESPPDARVLTDPGPLGELARDGAGCVGCHLQDPDVQDDSRFSGHHRFVADRRVFGPHPGPEVGPMRAFTTFTPTQGPHVQDGALCGGCHTLATDALQPDGQPTGHTLTEQGTYLEWRSSDFFPPRGQTPAAACQSCHLPIVDLDGAPIRTAIARNPAGQDFPRLFPREPVGRHLLVGGNTFALEVIRDHRALLGSGASEVELQAAIDATRHLLSSAADIEVLPVIGGDGTVTLPVRVHNRAGHKLPTGYPARRVWLYIRVVGPDGETLLESGAHDPLGRIVGADGRPLGFEAGPPPAHRQTVSRAEEVAVWQSWMVDVRGQPTTDLLRGVAFGKDNRILPLGHRPAAEDAPRIAPVGVNGDPDFSPGFDDVHVVLGAPPPEVTVEIAVRYQAFAPAFLAELLAKPVPEAAALRALVEGRGVPVETLAHVRRVVRTSP